MDRDTALIILASGGIATGIFAALLLLGRHGRNKPADRWLAALLGCCALNIAHAAWTDLSGLVLPLHGLRLVEPLQFLLAPLAAAYVRALVLPPRPFRATDWLHALPFPLVVLFASSGLARALDTAAGAGVSSVGLWVLLLVQAFTYISRSLRHVRGYRAALRDNVSNLAGIDLVWVSWFFHGLLGLLLGYILLLGLLVHAPGTVSPQAFLAITLSLLVWVLGYRGLLQRPPPVAAAESGTGRSGAKYLRSALPDAEADRLHARLERLMREKKPFLDPDLDLTGLADLLGISRNQLSFVLSQRCGRSFHDYVNEYRIAEIERLFLDPAAAGEKLLTLALDAGFNSKPSFNAVFKKLRGTTPSAWRQQAGNNRV